MTEDEWLACSSGVRMLEAVGCRPTDRKARLFRAACGRVVWPLLTDPASRACVDLVERLADGVAGDAERVRYSVAAERAYRAAPPGADRPARFAFMAEAVERMVVGGYDYSHTARDLCEEFFDPALARDVFGHPFGPAPALDPRWLSSTVVAIARGVYADRAFDRLPILADALQDAGCDDEDILDHCRGLGPHVRGCWVVDLLLGKG